MQSDLLRLSNNAVDALFWRTHPVEYMAKYWPGAEEAQEAIALSVRDHRRTAVVTSNGVGKTWSAGRIIDWFMLTHEPAVVVTTAGTWMQVKHQLWQEITTAFHELPVEIQRGKMNTTDWKITNKWYAIGLSTNDPGFFEGFHGKHILVVVDEAKSVNQGIFDAINRIAAGKCDMFRLLLISSTGNAEGPHYDSFHSKADMYSRIKISPFEAYQHAPGEERVKLKPTEHLSDEYIEEMKREYGEDSPLYKSMVLAEWSEDIAYRLFPPGNLRQCRDTVPVPDDAIVRVGADVARSVDGDECVFYAVYRWETPAGVQYQPLRFHTFHTGDSNVFERELITFCHEVGALAYDVNVDGTGIGGPSCNHLARDNFPVNEIQFGASATIEKPALAQIRSQLWWHGAEAARPDSITGEVRLHGLTDTRTIAQLGDPKYYFDTKDRIQVEPKKLTATRIAKERPRSPWRSPDRADALLLAIHEGVVHTISFLDVADMY